MKKIDVTVIGDINVDIITSKIENFPERDTQILVDNFELTSGGCAANFAKAISLLGLKTRFIGKIGQDTFGNFAINSLKEKKVELKISKGKKNTGVTIAVPFKDNTRSFITYTGTNSELGREDIKFELIEGSYLHVASFFLQGLRESTKELLEYAHSKGIIVTFDTGWDPKGWSLDDIKLIKKILAKVDIFFPNFREGKKITNAKTKEEVCEELLSLGPEIIALKLGERGSYIATQKENFFIPAFKVDVVDTTGAGDVFDAAFVYGHFKNWKLKKIGKFANAAAALSTRDYGSKNYPIIEEIFKLIN